MASKEPWGEGFDFSDLGLPFDFLPGSVQEVFSKGIIAGSKNLRMAYDEHLRQGFTEDEALKLVMSLQRDVLRALAYVGGEVGKILPELSKMQKSPDDSQKQPGG